MASISFLILIIFMVLVSIGVSYAYWKFVYMQSDKNVTVSKCLKLELSNEENIYPISDEEGRKLKKYKETLGFYSIVTSEINLKLIVIVMN